MGEITLLPYQEPPEGWSQEGGVWLLAGERGSGKTVACIEQARQHTAEGQRVVYVADWCHFSSAHREVHFSSARREALMGLGGPRTDLLVADLPEPQLEVVLEAYQTFNVRRILLTCVIEDMAQVGYWLAKYHYKAPLVTLGYLGANRYFDPKWFK